MIEIVLSIISGVISGLGMGGGTVLILFLSIFLGMDQHVAQATNLVFFIPTAIASSIINIKNKNVNFKVSIVIIIFGVIGSIIGAIVSTKLDVYLLKKIFGAFIIVIALIQLYLWYIMYIKNKNRNNKNIKT